ncbi:MAG TPA: nuclear transport factor 2 family protein [Actinospica sp.]|nr:nuclear transport factor 2 family protein [Actinospica sp.]
MSASPTRSARETVEVFLRTVVEGSREELADLYAPDVRIVNVWAPGGPSATEGREVLRARMAGTAKLWSFESLDDVVVHETGDPQVVIAEYRVNGRITASGRDFSLGFVSVLRIVDGLIAHARDYSNPEETNALMPLLREAGAG